MENIFEISFKDIERLNERQLTDLLRRLLYLEARKFNIPSSCIYGSLKINVPDGGEDARIKWDDGPQETNWIPSRFTLFQCKATEIYPSDCKKEILKENKKELKDRVEEVLNDGGTYILFYNKNCNTTQKKTREKKIEERIKSIRDGIKEAGKDYAERANIEIYDANQIAEWTNQYISSIIKVQEWLGKALPGELETWEMWAGYYENEFKYVLNDELESYIKQLRNYFTESKKVARIVGLSGLGKTRLAFEAFRPPEDSESNLEQQIRSNGVVYIDGSDFSSKLSGYFTRWRNEGRLGTIIVDNCEINLHKKLKKIVEHPDSSLSLLTIDYSFDRASDYDTYIELEPLSNEIIEEMLKQKYSGLREADISRIVEFSQGFPKMAALLAKSRLEERSNIGSLENDVLAKKLLWGRDGKREDYYKIISACSLFEYFGVKDNVVEHRKFIAEDICDIKNELFYEGIQYFIEKGILEQRGRFVRVTPKPLAIRLAANWWRKCPPEKAEDILTEKMPSGMQEKFCDQMAKLDFLPEAQNLVEHLCGEQAPFGQAEVLNTEKGSRLFRSLVEVAPNATARALENAFGDWTKEQLLKVGPGRRNLIWSLEKLCFREETFFIGARMMLKFAVAENESWGNNATNQFLQLFNTFLSGTQAPPELRFKVIDEALNKNNDYKFLVIKALGHVIKTRHFSRMGGAESQGSQAPKKDWEPELWEDAFDYWRKGLKYLTDIACKEKNLKLKKLACEQVVKNIRGLVSYGLMDELENTLEKIYKSKDTFWIEAYKEIQEAIKYEGSKIPKEGKNQLKEWLNMLEPKSLEGRLKLFVSQPPWLRKEELQEDIKELSKECANNRADFFDNLEIIFEGEQRNGYNFGNVLAKQIDNHQFFIEKAILTLKNISVNEANVNVLGGYLATIRSEFPALVTDTLEKISEGEKTYIFSVDLIRLSDPTFEELDILLSMVKNCKINIDSLKSLSLGGILDDKPAKDVMDFVSELVDISKEAVPIGFKIIYMYCYRDEERFKKCKAQLREILLTPGLISEEEVSEKLDYYNWKETVSSLLKDEDRDEELARHIGNEILERCENFETSGIAEERYHIRPVINILLKEYAQEVWPIFGNALLSEDEVLKFNLQRILKSRRNKDDGLDIASVLNKEFLTKWCNDNPNQAPVELAKIVEIIKENKEKMEWTTIAEFLFDNYGDNEKVLSAIYSNIRTITWWGSLVPYLKKVKFVFSNLLDHKNESVRNWARNIIDSLNDEIEKEKRKDEEEKLVR